MAFVPDFLCINVKTSCFVTRSCFKLVNFLLLDQRRSALDSEGMAQCESCLNYYSQCLSLK